MFKLIFILTALSVYAQAPRISLNNMEPPKTELFYSNENPQIGDTLYLNVVIPQGWHINAEKVPDDFLVPSKTEAYAPGVEFEPTIWPEPVKQYNDLLNMELLLLQDTFTIKLPIKNLQKNSNPYGVEVKFTYQACSNICLPPKTLEIFLGEKKNTGSKTDSFFLYILLALLGGLLLNFMPCVLPALFWKINDLVRKAGKGAFATTAGICFSFAVIALIIVIVRSTGNAIGWGFQFQHPAYIATMALGIMIFALNLFGIFEIVMPGDMQQNLDKYLKSGAFVSGIALVLLSTPCSAPFLGTALGFAFAAPIPKLFAIFAAVAIGLSSPYLILGLFPQLANKIPRPSGKLAGRLKQALSFPMLLTVVWLVWIFAKETGIDSAAKLGVFLCIAWFVAWFYEQRRSVILWLVFIVIYIFSFNFWINPQTKDLDEQWVSFSQKKLESLQKDGLAVWVNGSADWCITCKVNEKVFEHEVVEKAFKEKNVVKMRADYTNSNEEALKFFESYGRSAVPFDLFITSHGKTILLSEILTEDAVLEALNMEH